MSFWLHRSRLSLMILSLPGVAKTAAVLLVCSCLMILVVFGWYLPTCRALSQRQVQLSILKAHHDAMDKVNLERDGAQARYDECVKQYKQSFSLHNTQHTIDMLLKIMKKNNIACHSVQQVSVRHKDDFDIHHVLVQSRGVFHHYVALFDDLEKCKELISFKYVTFDKGNRSTQMRCSALIKCMTMKKSKSYEIDTN